MRHVGQYHSRRRTLVLGLSAAIAGSAGRTIRPAKAAVPDFGNPADALTAFVKTRGSTDGSLGLGWIAGRCYAVVDGRVTPLFGLLANTFFKFTRISDTEFEMRTFEIGYYLDLDTGTLLDTWENPLTEKRCDVPHIRLGPRVVPLRPGGFDYSAVPRTRTMEAENVILPPLIVGDDVWITDESTIAGPPSATGERGFRYNGITTYQAKLSDLAKPGLVTVPAAINYQGFAGFSPWMEMTGIDGTLTDRGSGRRVFRIEDLPPYYLELTEKYHADVLNDPMATLMGPRGYE